MSGPSGGGRIYGQHGTRHGPRGSDPGATEGWRDLVDPGTAWSSGTDYSPGDIVDNNDLQWECIVANGPGTDVGVIQPGATDMYFAYWWCQASVWVNGGPASPTTAVPNPVPPRYRLSVGPPNFYDEAGDLVYTHHQIDIQLDADGLVIGDTVFIMPPEYRHDYDVPYHTHDKYGAYVPCRLLASGEFIWGQV